MIVIAGITILVFFSIQVFSLVSILLLGPAKSTDIKTFPKVSLLLAARNEEKLIIRSLEAIDQLDYPKKQLEILIGDDSSTDKTAAIVRDFIKGKPQYKLYSIDKTLGKGRGKANVLAQLALKADGDFYFITDVDVKLPKLWIKSMLQEFGEKVGIVSGTTMCDDGPRFAKLQSIDWLHFMGYIKAFARVGVGCTSVGNNMAVRAPAYWETGGYEKIDFSITEDYKLFEAVTKNGWQWRNVLSPDTLGKAWYIPDVGEMLHQRKRWLIGAQDLPLNWKAMLIIYGLFYVVLIYLGINYSDIAMSIWFMKYLIQTVFILVLCYKVDMRPFRYLELFFYEIYLVVNTIVAGIFYFLPIKSVWKGRRYSGAEVQDLN